MNPWRPVDWLGKLIHEHWTPLWQIRTGVLLTLGGIGVSAYGFVSTEPPLIYQMSAIALVIGGLGVVITAVLAIQEDEADSIDELVEQQKGDN